MYSFLLQVSDYFAFLQYVSSIFSYISAAACFMMVCLAVPIDNAV